MPIKVETYACQYCEKEFSSMIECEEHEKSHIKDYGDVSTDEVLKMLKQIKDSAYGYHIGNETMGIPTENFISLLDTAIKRLCEIRWIPVTEKLPETADYVLVSCQTKKGAASVNRAYYADGFWHGSGSMSGVTAWMPMPKPY